MRSDLPLAGVFLAAVSLALLVSCGGGGGGSSGGSGSTQTGSATVSVSDPPSCRFPNGNFKHVYVSIRSVQAHLSASAGDTDAGWRELAPQLATAPVQVDLLGLPANGCTLAMLGSTMSLPVGDYQQIRLILVANNASGSDPRPATNACGLQGFNCVVLGDDSVHQLDLSSQANTGLKIPPGQVVGGPIRVSAGQNVDINIDFNTCAALVPLPNGNFRLRPTLTAGQVSTVTTGISGQVVDSATMMPISGGMALVALEQADSTSVDRIIMQAAADSSGNFNFCPVPTGMYDVVAVATGAGNTAYGASIVFNVPQGSAIGRTPLVAQGGMTPAGPATIQGTAAASTGTAPMTTGANVDVGLSALQSVTPSGGTMRQVTIPLQGMSTGTVTTAAAMTCPAGTNCASYTLIVPPQNPSFGTFAAAGTMFSTPAMGDVLFNVEGRATMVMSSGLTPICSPSTVLTDKDAADMPLKVTAGMTTMAKLLNFTACM